MAHPARLARWANPYPEATTLTTIPDPNQPDPDDQDDEQDTPAADEPAPTPPAS